MLVLGGGLGYLLGRFWLDSKKIKTSKRDQPVLVGELKESPGPSVNPKHGFSSNDQSGSGLKKSEVPVRVPTLFLLSPTPSPNALPTLAPAPAPIFSPLPSPSSLPAPTSSPAIIDTTPPISQLAIATSTQFLGAPMGNNSAGNSAEGNTSFVAKNAVENGQFEQNLASWQTTGQVAAVHIDDEKAPLWGVNPSLGLVAQLGNVTNGSEASQPSGNGSTNELANQIWQEIDNAMSRKKSLGFWYNLRTSETAVGFDEPALVVKINDQVVWQLRAEVASLPSKSGGKQTGWQYQVIDLSGFASPTFKLSIQSGNTGDEEYPSSVLIDAISTQVAVVPAHHKLLLTATDDTAIGAVHARYQLEGREYHQRRQGNVLELTLPNSIDQGVFEYWSEDLAGNTEAIQSAQVVVDIDRPTPVLDLAAWFDLAGTMTLKWTAPNDPQDMSLLSSLVFPALNYDVRVAASQAELTTANWFNLPQLTPRLPITSTEGWWLSSPSGQTELFQAQLAAAILPDLSQYWLSVRVKDSAGNLSEPASPVLITTKNE